MAIYEGWFDIDTNVFKSEITDNCMTYSRSTYLSFDHRYITDIMSKIDKEPVFISDELKKIMG